jgi:hypothetical protein
MLAGLASDKVVPVGLVRASELRDRAPGVDDFQPVRPGKRTEILASHVMKPAPVRGPSCPPSLLEAYLENSSRLERVEDAVHRHVELRAVEVE